MSIDTDSESDLSQKVDIVASKVGTTPRELKRRILEDDLQNIPMLEGWSEVFRMVLENSTLRDWYACKGESATYMVLAEKLVVAKKPKMVEQVCRMAKVSS